MKTLLVLGAMLALVALPETTANIVEVRAAGGMASCLGLGRNGDQASHQGKIADLVPGPDDGLLLRVIGGNAHDVAYLKWHDTNTNTGVVTYIFTGSIDDDTIACTTGALGCLDPYLRDVRDWVSVTTGHALAGEILKINAPPIDPGPTCPPGP